MHAWPCGRDAGRPLCGVGLVPELPRVDEGVVSLLHRVTFMASVAFVGQVYGYAVETVE